ncbi:hypothetical protein SAMN05216276_108122 [Streptosporangium subroseum]|uniref:Uncharacterized protein n=1 Tax=Streptosporangium subroseum TaxID=106412 RepID=A0A239P1Z0_9ACTN|nr:hypothetical protein SAMN05216276_108122 [Streptosporangium subroseum]
MPVRMCRKGAGSLACGGRSDIEGQVRRGSVNRFEASLKTRYDYLSNEQP